MAIIEIKPVTRIEGDAKLELDTYTDSVGNLRAKNSITPNDGTLALPTNNGARYPKFCVTEFRGFEKMVLGETPETFAKLVPRVCGVCPVQHSVAASTAIEAAYGFAVSNNANAIRRLMIAVNTVHSHLLHMFVMAGRDFLPHATLDSELANVIAAHNKAQACVAVFGGKPVHPAACLPGGQTQVPSANDLSQIKARMQEINGYITSRMSTMKSSLLNIPADVGKRSASYLSSGIPFYTGISGSYSYDGNSGGVLLRSSSAPGDFTASALVPFNPSSLKEEVVTPAGNTTALPDKSSYARRPYYAYNGTNYVVEVGPLARIAVAYRAGDPVVKPKVDSFASSWGLAAKDMLAPNTRNRHIARLLET